MITLALSKGRIFDEAQPLLKAAGMAPVESAETSRRLIIATEDARVRIVVVRASDVPTYVQYGAAELGVAGKDVLLEHSAHWGDRGLYQPVDLGIARCRLCVAVPSGFDYASAVRRGARLRVATKYVQTAREHFAAKGVHVDLIKLYGSMELAPLAGLADAIVDLVSSGGTLKANDLVEVEEITSRVAAEAMVGATLLVDRAQLEPPGPDEVFLGDLLGLAAHDETGRALGPIQSIFDAGAVPNLVLTVDGEEVMVPLVPQFVLQIDLAARRIVLTLPVLADPR